MATNQRHELNRTQQVTSLWTAEDGDDAALTQFAREHFNSDPAELEAVFGRFETALEQLDGITTRSPRVAALERARSWAP